MTTLNQKALIIDDEADIRELIALTLERIGVDAHTASNLTEAENLLNTYQFDVCLSDMRLPDGNGASFISRVHELQPALPVAVITAHGNMEAAVEAMKNGAFDFVSKPVDLKLLRRLVMQAISCSEVEPVDDQRYLQNAEPKRGTTASSGKVQTCEAEQLHDLRNSNCEHQLIGDSPPILKLRRMIEKVAKTNAPVWITGESGTGKELIARLIHKNSPRAGNSFIAVNCGAIPSELMESEMFGHLKGSFTGAHSDNAGLFQQAGGGTLFLDEVSELPLNMQVKLLRAIQERAVKPVGSSVETPVDVRILSACNVHLASAVEEGRFRNDLYYRLNVICIESPPLRSRLEDIPLLVNHIMRRSKQQSDLTGAPEVTGEFIETLKKYNFPGNVRELENMIERACALSEGRHLKAADLPILETPSQIDSISSSSSDSLGYEQEQILAALEETRWNRTAAARLLGVSYRQLRYRISKLGLEKPPG